MNSTNLINFQEEDNNIPYFWWYQEIGDFHLEKNIEDKKIINNAKVWYTVYWVKNIEELKNTNKKIIVVIPALTWTSKIFDTEASQWNGWANPYWKPGNILDPNENIIISLDYFGSGFNNHKDKHNLDFYPVPPEKQVEAWKKTLEKLWVKEVDMLFGWSNWWWHIHHWLIWECKKYEPKILIPVAGPIAPTEDAKEFFRIQLDFLNNKAWIWNRLNENLKELKSKLKPKMFDFLIEETIKEINENTNSKNDKKIMKIVRQIWFLKFVWPEYFDKFNNNKDWKKLKQKEAIDNMMNYFEKEWKRFEKRFWKSYLKILLQWIIDAERISPEEYVKKVSKKVDLIIISIKDDKLFDSISMWKYFMEVKEIRELRWDTWKTIFKIIKSSELSLIASHDYFLWEQWGQEISDSILTEIKKIKWNKNTNT